MTVKIIPSKLDGEITTAGLYAEYLNGASLIGNRIKVNGNKDIVKYLLSYNAKGTSFDLTEREDYIPILAFCACFACSDTKITAGNKELIKETISAITSMGGFTEATEYGFIVHGKDSLNGGEVKANDKRVLLASLIASTCANQPSTIYGVEKIEEIAPNFINEFVSLGGDLKLL